MAPDDRGKLPTLMLTDLLPLPDPRPHYAWYVLEIVTLVHLFSFLNRRVESPIREAVHKENVGCLGTFWCQELGWQVLVWPGGSIDTDMR